MSKDSSSPVAKPFPGHLAIWYEEEERKNPGWSDFSAEENAAKPVSESEAVALQITTIPSSR